MEEADNTTISNNNILFENEYTSGINYCVKISNSDNVTMHKNTCSNSYYLVHVDICDTLIITNNTLENGISYGLYLSSTVSNSSIYYNRFMLNNLLGASQAYDDGTTNIWYNTSELVGNLWSNWDGIGSYSIDGSSSSEDLYPIDIPLQFLETPEAYVYLEGTVNNFLNWTAFDNNPDFYKIFRNNTEINNGTWISGIPISILIDGLSFGIYNFTILMNDTAGNVIIDDVWITVVENLSPDLVCFTDDYTFVEGVPNQEIYWYIETDDPGTYWIYQDGSEIDTGSLEQPGEGLQLHISLDHLTQGIYNFTIKIQDSVNNIVNDTVWITVEENYNLPPVITSPGNKTFTLGVGYHGWDWYVYDQDLDQFWVYRDGVEVRHGWLIGEQLNHGIDLPEGVYNFTLVVSDHLGNIAVDTIWVTIESVEISEYSSITVTFFLPTVIALAYLLKRKTRRKKNS